ncbi:MAG: hypothetical protein ABJL67_09470 [Sulfitobacter sp.]
MAKERPPREKAARALCALDGHPPDIKMNGQPMWCSYLDQVDVVLGAALPPENWEKIKGLG